VRTRRRLLGFLAGLPHKLSHPMRPAAQEPGRGEGGAHAGGGRDGLGAVGGGPRRRATRRASKWTGDLPFLLQLTRPRAVKQPKRKKVDPLAAAAAAAAAATADEEEEEPAAEEEEEDDEEEQVLLITDDAQARAWSPCEA
jgi:hypothetical protein